MSVFDTLKNDPILLAGVLLALVLIGVIAFGSWAIATGYEPKWWKKMHI